MASSGEQGDTADRRGPNSVRKFGAETTVDPDVPREGRLASLKTRGTPPQTRGSAPKITFKPKAVARRKREGAPESLLSIGGAGSSGGGNNEEGGSSGAHMRRAERGRGRGRGARAEAPLMASGPFAQGPAISSVASGRGGRPVARNTGRMMDPTRTSYATGQTGKQTGKQKPEDELNLDDSGHPMQNLLRMRDETSDFWAPVTTDRIERTLKETQIAPPSEDTAKVRVKQEAEDLGFIDVKTEPSDSTLTSRVPTPEPAQADTIMPDVDEGDDEDIVMPTGPSETKVHEVKARVERDQKKGKIRVLSAEESEEQERLSLDLASLRTNLDRGGDEEERKLIFIQLPDILPFWQPGPDDQKNDSFVKSESIEADIVEIDQRQEDGKEEEEGVKDEKAAAAQEDAKREDGKEEEAATRKKRGRPKPVKFPTPEGCIGQLHVHRSGRITCDWGNIKMDVGTGSECGFLQEVVVMNPKVDKAVWSLGPVTSRMMMSPNLDDLLGVKG